MLDYVQERTNLLSADIRTNINKKKGMRKMAELLESTMLICFGLSWPMNLTKNIKAKSAKNMSLQFILLIIFGYIAGISAKIYNHKFNYVLVVYLLNLVVVSANVIVYFINRRYDKENHAAKKNYAKNYRVRKQLFMRQKNLYILLQFRIQ